MTPAVFDKHPAAEQFAADLKLLSHTIKDERVRACRRLGEAGSAAVRSLLNRAIGDEAEVRREAIWSVVRIGDGQGCTEYDGAVIKTLMVSAWSHEDPFVRIGAFAADARQSGRSAAAEASVYLSSRCSRRREAAVRFLERLIRDDPHRDADLQEVLVRACQHRNEAVRNEARGLLTMFEENRAVHRVAVGPDALLNGNLDARRSAAGSITPSDATATNLLCAAISDPDRTVRRLAGIKLFAYLRAGHEVEGPEAVRLLEEEAGPLFSAEDGWITANPSFLSFAYDTLRAGSVEAKQRVLQLISDLSMIASEGERTELNELIRLALRDKNREVRRYATAALRDADSGAAEVLAGRLKQHWRGQTPTVFVLSLLAQAAVFAVLIWTPHRHFAFAAMALTGLVVRVSPYLIPYRGEPPVEGDEFYETLCALEPVAQARPEELRDAIPHLRTLSSRMGTRSPEVRAKARELLAKVQEATSHELPIAATAPSAGPEALPIPGGAPEAREGAP